MDGPEANLENHASVLGLKPLIRARGRSKNDKRSGIGAVWIFQVPLPADALRRGLFAQRPSHDVC